MSDNNQEVQQEKRKYVKSGNPRSTLWQDICKEHGIKNYRKDSPDYQRARELYKAALELKKKGTPITTTSGINHISMSKVSPEQTYVEELPESKVDQEAKQLVQPKAQVIATDSWSKKVQKSITIKPKNQSLHQLK